MPTIIDALVVSLGLDAKAVVKGAQQAMGTFKNVQSSATKMGSGVAAAADTAGDAFHSLERKALAFFAVLTAGKTLKAFISDTTSANVAAGNMARNLGVSVNSLTAWQKAAQAVGGSAEDVSGSLGSLVSQFQTIDGRRNLGMVFGQMGVRLEGANGQLRDMNGLMPDLARAAQRLGPQLFSALGSQAGFSQGFINLLEQGPEHIQKLYASLQKYAPTERDTRASAQLLEDWTKLTAQSEAFGRSIMTDLSPEVHDLMQWVSGLIDRNQIWLRQDIDKYIKKFGDEIQSVDWRGIGQQIKQWRDYLASIDWSKIGQDVKDFASGADNAAKAVGGWQNVAEGLFALWVGSKFLAVLRNVQLLAAASGAGLGGISKLIAAAGVGYAAHKGLEAADPNDDIGGWMDSNVPGASFLDNLASKVGMGRSYAEQNARKAISAASPADMIKIANMSVGMGWSREQAMGLLSNAMSESNLDPFSVGDNGGAYGLFQWHGDRQAQYAARYGHTMQSVKDRDAAAKEQMDFANWELSHTEKQAGDYLRKATDAGMAGAIVSRYFERPKDQDGEVEKRGALAEYLSSQKSVVGAALSTPTGGGTTNNVTNNMTLHVPGGDPKQVTKAVKAAFNDPRMQAWQTNMGLV
ncbi:phage tail tip lysozyme [Acetobacter senegalensis]|uniref:phage tail tip lysozyme n=1 Tax=Acetobacter senegalensis TaxID=446692 RepID=UPI000777468F|nr:phage tail tip lysozyme [Acetobacter senegalensis]